MDICMFLCACVGAKVCVCVHMSACTYTWVCLCTSVYVIYAGVYLCTSVCVCVHVWCVMFWGMFVCECMCIVCWHVSLYAGVLPVCGRGLSVLVHLSVEGRGQPQLSFFRNRLPLILKTEYLISFPSKLSRLNSEPQRSVCICFPSSGTTGLYHSLVFLVCGYWGSNSGSHACKASI